MKGMEIKLSNKEKKEKTNIIKKEHKKEVDEKYMRQLYSNIIRAIVIIFYFLVLNILNQNISDIHMEISIKILTMVFLLISIIIFEIAYKKDSDGLAILGLEVLMLAIYTITTKHITSKFNFDFEKYSYAASYVFAIYFILKSIIIYTKGRKKMADERSDIREIVKKEPIKKEATKKEKEVKKND